MQLRNQFLTECPSSPADGRRSFHLPPAPADLSRPRHPLQLARTRGRRRRAIKPRTSIAAFPRLERPGRSSDVSPRPIPPAPRDESQHDGWRRLAWHHALDGTRSWLSFKTHPVPELARAWTKSGRGVEVGSEAEFLTLVTGPTCMTDDRLGQVNLSDTIGAGDLRVWLDAGASHLPWETRLSHRLCVVWADQNDSLSLVRPARPPSNGARRGRRSDNDGRVRRWRLLPTGARRSCAHRRHRTTKCAGEPRSRYVSPGPDWRNFGAAPSCCPASPHVASASLIRAQLF